MSAPFDSQQQPIDPGRVGSSSGSSPGRLSFADEVRGPAPRDIDIALAHMAQDVYRSDDDRRPPIAGWKPLSDEQLQGVGIDPTLRSNASSGFDADIYTDGNGRFVLAYRGTDAGKDWATNLGQGLGFETSQYNQAMMIARQAKVAFGDELVITGHSLGGGLAAVGAAVTGAPAVTFNAAGVKDATLERVNLDPGAVRREAESGQIRRYAVDNEILTELQEKKFPTRYLMADAIGNKIELPDPDPLSFWQNLNPVKSIKHSIDMHLMDAVIRAQEKAFGHGLGENGLMSHPDHAFNRQYQRMFDQVQPMFEERGMSIREAQNVAGALALEAQRTGVVPDRVAMNGDRVFAIQGDRSETARYASVGMQAAELPLVESSRQSLHVLSAQQQSVGGAAQSQVAGPEPGVESPAQPLRARL